MTTARRGPNCEAANSIEPTTDGEAVLPDGRVVRSKINPRRSAGPDVASLMIGSEGTLGIVTAVCVRILPRPPAVRTLLLDFMSHEELEPAQAATHAVERAVRSLTTVQGVARGH